LKNDDLRQTVFLSNLHKMVKKNCDAPSHSQEGLDFDLACPLINRLEDLARKSQRLAEKNRSIDDFPQGERKKS
jgi:hypothetical protein